MTGHATTEKCLMGISVAESRGEAVPAMFRCDVRITD